MLHWIEASGPAGTGVVAGAGEVGTGQVRRPQGLDDVEIFVTHGLATHRGAAQVHARQIGILEFRAGEVSVPEIGLPEVGPDERCAPKVGAAKLCPSEIRSVQINAAKICAGQTSAL